MNLKALTTTELESALSAIDAFHAAYDLISAHCMDDSDDLTTEELHDALVAEMTERAYVDAGFKVNVMVGRGEVDRYMRPDGKIGYAPPGAWDELL